MEEDRSDALFDDDTVYFVQLWDYVQSMSNFEKYFNPEDVVLLDELVNTQNFSVALDLLRQRIKEHGLIKHMPDELQEIARPPKCGRVVKIPVKQSPFENDMKLKEFQKRKKCKCHHHQHKMPEQVDLAEEEDDDNVNLIAEQDMAYEAALLEDMKREHEKKQKKNQHLNNIPEPEPLQFHQPPPPPQTKTFPISPKKEQTTKKEEVKEPDENDPNAILVCVTVPSKDGLRLERRFDVEHDLVRAVLLWLSDKLQTDEQTIKVCTNFPKAYYDPFVSLKKCPLQKKRLLLFCEIQ